MDTVISAKSTTVAFNFLFQSSDYHSAYVAQESAKRAAEAAAVVQKTPSKTPPLHPRTPGSGKSRVAIPQPAQPRRTGEIIQSDDAPLPPFPPSVDQPSLCIPHIKKGKTCRKDKCPWDHPASIKDWQPQALDVYCTLVANHDNLSWNKEVIPSDLLAKLNLE